MADKTPQEQVAAARQAELLITALQGASEDGHWLNMKGRMALRIYGHAGTVSPFNALMFALHADAHGYATAVYTSFADARKRGEAVQKDERSVSMNWYRRADYVNRHDERDVISRSQYQALPPDQQNLYKAVRQREIRSLFNVEQTTMPMTDSKTFQTLTQRYGGIADRGNVKSEERQLHTAVSQLRRQISDFLVPIRKSTDGSASYDPVVDLIRLPEQKHYAHYNDYVHDLLRQAVAATGHRQRLAHEGMLMQGGKSPSDRATNYERLVAELASGIKMMQLGLPARLAEENKPLVEQWTQDLRENPCRMDAIESDVNNALDMLHKVEQGEKLPLADERTRQQTEEMRERSEKRPQVSSSEALILLDIIRKGGMGIDSRNFSGETPELQQETKKTFMEKFSNLSYYDDQVSAALWNVERMKDDPDLVNAAYTAAASEAARIQRVCTEWVPREWEEKGVHFIADELDAVPDKRSKEFVVVRDTSTGIADVILPASARSGGNVVMPNGDRRNFWITPDEVMTADERKEAGATVFKHNQPGLSKEKIERALMADGASYVRFFNKDGDLRYHPDDAYFKGKEAYAAKLSGKDIAVTSRFDLSEAVHRATEVQFERVQMMLDDNGRWVLYLKAKGEQGFAIYPDKSDTNRFFATVKQDDREAAQTVRGELAQKYHALAQASPNLKTNLFGTVPDGIDPRQIERVNIFKNKQNEYVMVAKIAGKEALPPRPISREQWQRLWMAEDTNAYKTALAANVFADVLMATKEHKDVANEEETITQSDNMKEQKPFPNLKQYEDLKGKHPDAVLLFRIDSRSLISR